MLKYFSVFPALTVANIADQLNFSNQFIFSKFFKKQTGMSPSQFRSTIK
ncbi:helix-turn-helix domain-containing protein [Niabella sp. CJ426]